MSFNFLHLTDLHISDNEDPTQKRLRNCLIEDIKQLARESRIDAIIMTGDTFDRGGNENTIKLSSEFYNLLLNELNLSYDRLLIVPGNHDIVRRNRIDPKIFGSFSAEYLETYKDSMEFWDTVKGRFQNYHNLLNTLSTPQTGQDLIFGSAIHEINHNDKKIRFFLMNSTWAAVGESDFGNLYIGRWQLEKLLEAAQKRGPADFSFALVHHPLNWLNNTEKEMVTNFFTNELKIDAMFHGHIHTGDISYTGSPDGRLLSLVSGIGYPEKNGRQSGMPKISACRYALYNFKYNEGTADVILRISRENGTFGADTLLYEQGKENGRFSIVYNEQKKQTYNLQVSNNAAEVATKITDLPYAGGLINKYVCLYSTNTKLSYMISKKYYNDTHYIWCSPEFDAKNNLQSANPKEIFNKLKVDITKEQYSVNIERVKAGLLRGVEYNKAKGIISEEQEKDIISIIQAAPPKLFSPVLYIIPTERVKELVKYVPIDSRMSPLSEEFVIEELPGQFFDHIEF
ncbi:metallophosphoesterase family protein [Paenibacillus urinalis]|uniref:metallophosphoesterase family protein n=1 Tax=Paenibacillus urinalis TaxID=521520 RepID=UPI0019610E56